MRTRPTLLICLIAGIMFLCGSACLAGEYYVDQKHPQATDANPGTEALPWQTINKAVGTAEAGDTVWIKAGKYHEGVSYFAHSGEYYGSQLRFITLAAFGNDEVVIDGTRKVEPAQWTLNEGTKNVFYVPLAIEGTKYRESIQVFVDGKRYPEAKELKVEDKPDYERGTDETETHQFQAMSDANPGKWLHDQKAKVLYLNTGDGNPSQKHLVEVSIHSFSLDLKPRLDTRYGGRGVYNTAIRLRGLTFDRMREGVTGYANMCVIEDCVVSRSGGDGIILAGMNNIIRRNTVLHTAHQAIYWAGSEFVLEDNLVVGALQDPNIFVSAWEGVFKTNGGRNSTIRNNVVCEVEKPASAHAGSGIWCDIDSAFNAIYGNVSYRQGSGMYVEYTQSANLIAYNTCFENSAGVGVRVNGYNLFLENYLFDNDLAMWFGGSDRYPPMRGQRVEANWFVNNKNGVSVGVIANSREPNAAPFGWNSVSLDANVYDMAPGGTLVEWGKDKYTDLKKLTTETGQEFNGKARKATEDEIRVVKFRVPHSRTPDLLVPMVANPTLMRVAPSGIPGSARPYFWRQGDGSGVSFGVGAAGSGSATGGGVISSYPNLPKLWADGGSVPVGMTGLVLGPDGKAYEKHEGPGEKRWGISVKGVQPQDMHPLGEGWWSPTLPTVAGTKYAVSWASLADDLKPTEGDPKAGPVVFVQFTNDTGQQKTRQYLWGLDDAGQPHGELAAAGSYGWAKDGGEVAAPPGATRVAFFFGLRNSAGVVKFRDMYIEAK